MVSPSVQAVPNGRAAPPTQRQSSSNAQPAPRSAGSAFAKLLAGIRNDMRQRWQRGDEALVDDYREQLEGRGVETSGWLDLIVAEVMLRDEFGKPLTLSAYEMRFPELKESLRQQLHVLVDRETEA